MNANARIISPAGEAETKIGSPPGVTYGTFVLVYFQLEPVLDKPRGISHHPLCSFLAANVDYKVVRITDEAQSGGDLGDVLD